MEGGISLALIGGWSRCTDSLWEAAPDLPGLLVLGLRRQVQSKDLNLGFLSQWSETLNHFPHLTNYLLSIQPLIGKPVLLRAVPLLVAIWKLSMPSLGALLGAERVAGGYVGASQGEMTLGCTV